MSKQKLSLDRNSAKISGVIAGISKYFGIDVGLLRIGFIFFVIFTGFFPGVFFYILAVWTLENEKPSDSLEK